MPNPPPLPSHPSQSQHLSYRSLQQLDMLCRMRLLHITLRNLLHHEIRINVDLLAQLAIGDTPLAADSQYADGGLGVDKGVDAVGDVGEGEFVCCLVGLLGCLLTGGRREAKRKGCWGRGV